jgi:PAS domain S-box-containing protein
VLGYAPAELLGTRMVDLVHPDEHEPALEFIIGATATRGITTPVEWRLRHRDGRWLYMEAIGNNLLDVPRVAGVVFTIRSTMERRQLNEQLRRLAFSDSLTGLANRALFRETGSSTRSPGARRPRSRSQCCYSTWTTSR